LSEPRKGWEGDIRIATTEAGLAAAANVPHVQSGSVEFANNVEAAYQLGSRDPQALKEGLIEITMSLDKRNLDWVIAGYAGVGSTGALTEYYIGIYPEKYGSGKRKLVLGPVKFDTWALEFGVEDFTEESVEIVAKVISVGTIA